MNFWLFLLIPLITALEKVNDYTFDKVVRKSGDYVLVDFYADWCRHCQQLMPTIEKLADEYQNVPGVNIVKLNGGDRSGRKMVKKYEIDGFPMMVLFHGDDKPLFYEGSRDFESINNFIKLASGVNEVKNPEIIPVFDKEPNDVIQVNDYNIEEKVLRSDKKTLMFVGGEWCRHCNELKPKVYRINEIFKNDDNFQVVSVMLDPDQGTTNKIRIQFGIKEIPSLLFFDPSKTDEDGLRRPELYTGRRNVKDILYWVNKHGFSRQQDGRLDNKVGILDLNLKLLKKDIKGLMNKIERFDIDENIKTYYGKMMYHYQTDKSFFETEINRLEKMVEESFDHINQKDIDWIDTRLNILRIFKNA
ncbi:putative protein disulfide-isomerase Tigap [[Candida] jaroonii]|uniref:Uncharacterized protein n=1 Tax=[Candida] jaroonii TaxID=467808 RepID=A0ACA9Y8X1_9ASCO|nr:putative protein disulfide-isomerase Tigap [[Candida] jaroonii]